MPGDSHAAQHDSLWLNLGTDPAMYFCVDALPKIPICTIFDSA
jgi:hypothetical protein